MLRRVTGARFRLVQGQHGHLVGLIYIKRAWTLHVNETLLMPNVGEVDGTTTTNGSITGSSWRWTISAGQLAHIGL